MAYFYNRRGTAEQWIKEGKTAVKWTKLSCRRFKDNAARFHLFALAYNLVNALRQASSAAFFWQYLGRSVDPALIAQDWMVIRHTMWNYVGLLRSERRLDRAGRILWELRDEIENFYKRGTMSDALLGLRNGVQTALAIRNAAMDNRVSRGSHYRTDGVEA